VVREGGGAGGRNDPSMYAHMNNETIKIKKKEEAQRLMSLLFSKRLVSKS
jgi:hypothetical protein